MDIKHNLQKRLFLLFLWTVQGVRKEAFPSFFHLTNECNRRSQHAYNHSYKLWLYMWLYMCYGCICNRRSQHAYNHSYKLWLYMWLYMCYGCICNRRSQHAYNHSYKLWLYMYEENLIITQSSSYQNFVRYFYHLPPTTSDTALRQVPTS